MTGNNLKMDKDKKFSYDVVKECLEYNGKPFIVYGDIVKVVELLNEKEQRIEELEHELISLNGLYASDKEDMSYPFRLDFSKILNK